MPRRRVKGAGNPVEVPAPCTPFTPCAIRSLCRPGQRYSIRKPEMALEMTSCWICSVPSKMSMVSRIRPAVSPESVTCALVRPSPSSPLDSGEF